MIACLSVQPLSPMRDGLKHGVKDINIFVVDDDESVRIDSLCRRHEERGGDEWERFPRKYLSLFRHGIGFLRLREDNA